jgi:hypothetical protein
LVPAETLGYRVNFQILLSKKEQNHGIYSPVFSQGF